MQDKGGVVRVCRKKINLRTLATLHLD